MLLNHRDIQGYLFNGRHGSNREECIQGKSVRPIGSRDHSILSRAGSQALLGGGLAAGMLSPEDDCELLETETGVLPRATSRLKSSVLDFNYTETQHSIDD